MGNSRANLIRVEISVRVNFAKFLFSRSCLVN